MIEKPKCKLVGEDGNVFCIIARVAKALKNAGMKNEAVEFKNKAFNSKSYDEVIRLAMEYTDVE